MGPLTQPRRKCVPIDILLLKQLYLIDKLPMREIAKYFGVSTTTIYHRLKELSLVRTRKKNLDPELVTDLYVNKGYSTSEIAEMLNTTKTTIRRTLHSVGVVLRRGSDAQYVPKSRQLKRFNGDPLTKVELLALRFTDFNSIRKRRRIIFETATTRAGMIKFVNEVCKHHARIRCKPRPLKWSPDRWEWNIKCSLDESYDFLLIHKNAIDTISWIIDEEESARLFMTRAIECDGYICVSPDHHHNTFRFSIGFVNSDSNILEFVRRLMEKYCYVTTYIQTKRTPAGGMVRCVFGRVGKNNIELVEKLPWEHPEKIWNLEVGVELCDEKITQEGIEKINETRQKILKFREKTMNLAKVIGSSPKGTRTISIEELIRLLGI